MKKLLLLSLVLGACEQMNFEQRNGIPKKPFIIIEKNFSENKFKYVYLGSNGVQRMFIEKTEKYNIGDTIK